MFYFKSYKSFINNTLNVGYYEGYTVGCMGAFSCQFSSIYALVVRCQGIASCMDTYVFGRYIWCYAIGSCDNLIVTGGTVYFTSLSTLGVVAQRSRAERGLVTFIDWNLIQATASMSLFKTDIIISGSLSPNIAIWVYIYGYYSLFNSNFVHYNSSNPIRIFCEDSNPQWFLAQGFILSQTYFIDDSCDTNNWINNASQINPISFEILTTIKMATKNAFQVLDDNNYNGTCDLMYDIGYPLHVDNGIIGTGNICCQASDVCSYATSMTAHEGSIYCSAHKSCVDIDSIVTLGDNANIFCLAFQSCYKSLLQSLNDIYCIGHSSCENTFILGAKSVYCTTQACFNSILSQIENIYFIDDQTNTVIYSGSVGYQNTYFFGQNAGTNIVYYCYTGDTCNIICIDDACNNESTVVYCDGKCNIKCHQFNHNYTYSATDENDYDYSYGSDCVQIASSLSPTAQPTDNRLLTQEELTMGFSYIVSSLIIITFVIVIVGILDTKYKRKNELFSWRSIVAVLFYTNDFISDIFFCLKLYTLWVDPIFTQRKEWYGLLFIASIVFTFVPVTINLVQCHFSLSKWIQHPILKTTSVPSWIDKSAKMVYFLSVVCGSSFSAIKLVNSYLFEWEIFSMGLPSYYLAKFDRKRFISVVVLEVKYSHSKYQQKIQTRCRIMRS